jgi:branched-chain amino acid aminotransferase
MHNLNGTLLEHLPDDLLLVQRGLYYGDSVFESIRVLGGRLPLWPQHWARLLAASRLMDYDWPSDWTSDFFHSEILKVLPAPNARVRLTVWRSTGGLYRPDNNTPRYLVSTQMLHADRYEWHTQGVRAGVCTSVYLPVDAYSGLKTLNAARYVAASIEAQRNGWDDVIILNAYKRVCEAVSSNVFWWEGDDLFTTPLADGPVTGVFRSLLLSLTDVKMPTIREKSITPEALLEADEVFLTNAVQGIRWVKYLQGKDLKYHKTMQLFEEVAKHFRVV